MSLVQFDRQLAECEADTRRIRPRFDLVELIEDFCQVVGRNSGAGIFNGYLDSVRFNKSSLACCSRVIAFALLL